MALSAALFAAVATSCAAGDSRGNGIPRVRIGQDGHGFVLEDGTPFFWLGDTGWLLFTLDEEERDYYLGNRAMREFNVIQCMVIRTNPLSKKELMPCPGGVLPFSSLAPLQFNESYFTHLDAIVDAAARHGLYLALATMWGHDADGLFRDPERDNYVYARFLGERYRDRPNVIWIASGEYEKIDPDWRKRGRESKLTARQKGLLSRLGEGLHAGCQGRNLITMHSVYTSARDFHDSPWLDFNMQQTWGHLAPNIAQIAQDYARAPPKPVLNGEPGYENRPEKAIGKITPWHLRNEGYWSVFSGAAGFTYGAHHVWEFDDNWRMALDFAGGSQMCHLRRLMESRPMAARIPRKQAVVSGAGTPWNQTATCAAGGVSGGYLLVYSASGLPFEIDMTYISGGRIRAWWFNPRDGRTCDEQGQLTASPFVELPAVGKKRFVPPTSGETQDWVLVLDDHARRFKAPGSR